MFRSRQLFLPKVAQTPNNDNNPLNSHDTILAISSHQRKEWCRLTQTLGLYTIDYETVIRKSFHIRGLEVWPIKEDRSRTPT